MVTSGVTESVWFLPIDSTVRTPITTTFMYEYTAVRGITNTILTKAMKKCSGQCKARENF